jgi:cob(I)alamin adenosyltransferase
MAWIEKSIEELSGKVHIPNQFIIPGDSLPEAAMDLARTIIRRAERRVAELFSLGEIENQDLLRYLNRLSSVCYLLELLENAHSGNPRLTLAKEDLEL